MCQHAFALPHKPPPRFRNAVPGCDGPTRKQASIAQQVLPYGVEAAVLLLERRDEILEEEICARLEGQRVLDRSLEEVGMGFDGVEGLVYGGGGDGVEEGDEGFDGGDGFCEVGIGGEEVSVGGDDAIESQNRAGKDSRDAKKTAYSKVESLGCVRKGSSVGMGCATARMRRSVSARHHRRMRHTSF